MVPGLPWPYQSWGAEPGTLRLAPAAAFVEWSVEPALSGPTPAARQLDDAASIAILPTLAT